MLLPSKTTLFKALFVFLPLTAFSVSTNAADLRRANPTATAIAIENAIEGSYIVVLKAPEAPRDGDLTQEEITRYVEETAVDMAARYRFEVEHIYSHALTGFSISAASETTVQHLERDLRVDYVAQDSRVFLDPITSSEDPPLPPSLAPPPKPPWIPPDDFLPVDPVVPPPSGGGDVNTDLPNYVQYKAPWGLDRIDQRDLPLNGTYQYNTTAANVHVYVIDSGVRATHQEFGSRILPGTNFVTDDPGVWGELGMEDCRNHGTHVAGIIGGSKFGVAKGVRIVPVRVAGCDGVAKGSWLLAGLDWVAGHVANYNTLPAIVNLSMGAVVPENNENIVKAEKKAVDTLIDLGITVVAAAMNDNIDACGVFPALMDRVITVGATAVYGMRWPLSNYGSCVNVFAPGVDVPSASHTSDTDAVFKSGTSMAAPHVAGVVALWYATDPLISEFGVRIRMKQCATFGRLSDIGPGSPNLLLYAHLCQ